MTTPLKFTKMQGLGNDFVVLDGVRQRVDLSRADIARLADRHFGVGCDQVLLVERPSGADADFRYRIFNADGGEVEQCGNGARCFVHFVRDKGLTSKRTIRVETRGGIIAPTLEADGRVRVDMGVPRFEAEAIPFAGDAASTIQTLDIAGTPVVI
ncbi:MAG: diaminopimelate epimerase, partial [Casimicrobiaceae bacterium]